jgi:hypothetical protein
MRDILLLRIFSEADRAHFAPRKRLEELRFVLRCWQEQTCLIPGAYGTRTRIKYLVGLVRITEQPALSRLLRLKAMRWANVKNLLLIGTTRVDAQEGIMSHF